eukprot:CAMPEP_0171459654 /NCGR_PEP_ID=MMETSP0945-20130129/4849_1 /TAXON_ID=109269 /ORGANISM="Vaucheria litorea, Strain CCMP2940" /LENGTH=145 /DNA_ID=CAMNT_0011985711 /DNA_START=817 /DNA_END=1254 /DNA_ORIENTATION=+
MYVLQASQNLVEEVLEMLVGEGLSAGNDAVHVALHEIRDDVDVTEVSGVMRQTHNIGDVDYVLVSIEVPQKLDFPQNSLRVGQIAEHIADLFDRDFSAFLCVVGRTNETVGTVSDGFEIFVTGIDVKCLAANCDFVVFPFPNLIH